MDTINSQYGGELNDMLDLTFIILPVEFVWVVMGGFCRGSSKATEE